MGSESDAQLLEAWRSGDRAAAEALTRRHYASVLRYFELNASWAADDLAQRTFMACVERAADVRETSAFRAYLMGIARRQLALHLRELATSAKYRGFEEASPARTQLSTLVARNHEQFLALRALAALPRRPQLLLVLYYWEGTKTPALAEAFDVPVSTIRTQLQRARDLLRRRMGELAGSGLRTFTDDDGLPALLASVLGAAPAEPPHAATDTRRG